MAENTEISWTDNTHNHWEGCTKVGPGCDHCYAEARNARFGGGEAVNWGPGAPRRLTSQHNRNLPLRWNKRAFFECPKCQWRGEMKFGNEYAEVGKLNYFTCTETPGGVPCGGDLQPARRRVFCSSLADVFDNEVSPVWRSDLWRLIEETPNLDWLLLTKRVGNVERFMPQMGLAPNVWLGATIVNQTEADRDIPKLLDVKARVRFLSMEPLLGDVRLGAYLQRSPSAAFDAGRVKPSMPAWTRIGSTAIDWVIVGGESGKDARPMHPDWARSLRDQCEAAGVAFHFKQWGEWAPLKGGITSPTLTPMERIGKKAAGRELDGRTHNAFPEVA